MKQRYDLIAFALLVFACVFLTAITVSPKTFAISDWQPLMAAILTLGGAGIVYRGATLAYRGAMAKVDLDRSIHEREIRRTARGVCLRVKFAMFVLTNDAEWHSTRIVTPSLGQPALVIYAAQIKLRTRQEIDEAWSNLDIFSSEVSWAISNVKTKLFNFDGNLDGLGSNAITVGVNMPLPSNVAIFKKSAIDLSEAAKHALGLLEKMAKELT